MASGLRSRKSDSALAGNKENDDSLTANRGQSTNEGKLTVTQSQPAATTTEAPIFATYLRTLQNSAALSCPELRFFGAMNATRYNNGRIARTTMRNGADNMMQQSVKIISSNGATSSAETLSNAAASTSTGLSAPALTSSSGVSAPAPISSTGLSAPALTSSSGVSAPASSSSTGVSAPASTTSNILSSCAADHERISTSGGLLNDQSVPSTSSQIGSVFYTVSGSSGGATVSNTFTGLQPLPSAFSLGDNESLGSQYAGHWAMPTGFATSRSAVSSPGNILSTNGTSISRSSAIQNSALLAALTRTLGLTQTLGEHGSSDGTVGGIGAVGSGSLQQAIDLQSFGTAQSLGSDNSAPTSRQDTSQLSSTIPFTGNSHQAPNVQELLNLGVAYGALAQQSPAACASLLALMQSNPNLPAPSTTYSTMHPVPPSSASSSPSVSQVATSTSSSSSDTARQRNVNFRGGRNRPTFYSSGRVRGRGRRGFSRGGYFQSYGGFAGYAAPPAANYPVPVQPSAPAWPVPLQQAPTAWYPPTTPPPAMYPYPSYPYANGAYQSYPGPHRFY